MPVEGLGHLKTSPFVLAYVLSPRPRTKTSRAKFHINPRNESSTIVIYEAIEHSTNLPRYSSRILLHVENHNHDVLLQVAPLLTVISKIIIPSDCNFAPRNILTDDNSTFDLSLFQFYSR